MSRDYQQNTGAGEGESNDRSTVAVPAIQLRLFAAVAAACEPRKTPLVVVIIGGGPLDLTPFKEDARVSALLWAGYGAFPADFRAFGCVTLAPQ